MIWKRERRIVICLKLSMYLFIQTNGMIKITAAGLSKELLYMKFLQGIPIVGAVGGFYDAFYMKSITKYANIKYRKRFLLSKK